MPELVETVKQPYPNYVLSGGVIVDDPVEEIFIKFTPTELGIEQGKQELELHLQAHEAAALIYCLSGALWSRMVSGGNS